jgi:hypothetical protein
LTSRKQAEKALFTVEMATIWLVFSPVEIVAKGQGWPKSRFWSVKSHRLQYN